VRFQAEQLLEDLKAEDKDKYQIVVESIEARLLTATKELMAQDPLKLLGFRQNEENRKVKLRELELKERALDLERERVHGVALDRAKLGEEFSADLLEYIGADAEGLRWFTKHLKPFNEFIANKYAQAKG